MSILHMSVLNVSLPNSLRMCFLTIGFFSIKGGIYVFQLLDWYIAAFCIPVFGIIECVVFGWIYGN